MALAIQDGIWAILTELELQKLLLKVIVSEHFLCLVFSSNQIKKFLVFLIFVELFIRCIHHRGIDLKGLREVNFSTIGVLPMGRSNHPWLNFNDCSSKGHGKPIKQLETVKGVPTQKKSSDSLVVNTPGTQILVPGNDTPGSRLYPCRMPQGVSTPNQ